MNEPKHARVPLAPAFAHTREVSGPRSPRRRDEAALAGRRSCLSLALIAYAALSSAAVAQTTTAYDCASTFDRRKVEIRYYREGDAPRCEVNYYTSQLKLKRRLWWARNDLPQCEIKARDLLERLRAGGFTCAAAGTAGAASPEGSTAGEPNRLTWGTAWAPRFGPKVEYPTELFSVPEPTPENNDGIGYRSADGQSSFSIWGASNVLGYGPAQAARFARDAFAKRQAVVTDFTEQGNWFAFSAMEAGKTVYQKAMIIDDGRVVIGLTIEFPESRKPVFDPIVSRMAGSLTAGPSEERCPKPTAPGRTC